MRGINAFGSVCLILEVACAAAVPNVVVLLDDDDGWW
jgi:hypothetical protein